MDRREFIKLCSVFSVGFFLTGCRRSFLGGASKVSGVPELKAFEDEVRRAMSMDKPGFELVRVPRPGELKIPGTSCANRFGMAIDLDACDRCGQCILACMQENNIALASEAEAARGRFMHWIEMRGDAPTMCFHCGDAPCEKVCPTGAATHTSDGVSSMMYKRCTGSRFCGAACPVNARKFNYEDCQSLGLVRKFNAEVPLREKGVMEKCTLCLQRLQNHRMDFKAKMPYADPQGEWRGRGLQTACAEACPRRAIVFGNWLDESGDLVQATRHRVLYVPRAVAALDPSVVYMRGRL